MQSLAVNLQLVVHLLILVPHSVANAHELDSVMTLTSGGLCLHSSTLNGPGNRQEYASLSATSAENGS